MYAVIRAGGKQYRVAPGDVIRIERSAPGQDTLEFTDVLAVSGDQGVSRPEGGARVLGRVVEQGRSDKVLVFHYKRKKQYKKLRGHRQPFTAVRITEIAFDGQKFTAPDEPERKPKAKRTEAPATAEAPATPAAEKREAAAKKKGGAAKKTAAKKAAPKKGASKGKKK